MKTINIKENLFALSTAFVLAFVVVFAVDRADLLTADILVDEDTQVEYGWDIVYYIEEWEVYVDANSSFDRVASVSIDLYYDEGLEVWDLNIDSDFDYSSANIEWAWEKLIFTNIWEIGSEENIFSFPFDWDDWEVTLSDVVVNFTDWSTERLSISAK